MKKLIRKIIKKREKFLNKKIGTYERNTVQYKYSVARLHELHNLTRSIEEVISIREKQKALSKKNDVRSGRINGL